MKNKLIFLVILSTINFSAQSVDNNEVEVEDVSPFQEAANAVFQDDRLGNIGGMISNFLQSEGGKQLGDMVMGATGGNDVTSQIIQGIGSILTQNAEGGGTGLEGNLMGNVLGMLGQSLNTDGKGSKEGSELDLSSLLPLLGSFMSQGDGNKDFNVMDYLPMVLQTISSFVGKDAEAREGEHKNHAGLLPPIMEKLHVWFDHFMHSDIGKLIVHKIGAQNIAKVFADKSGQFNYDIFTEHMENLSFRRHWLKKMTEKVLEFVVVAADPKVQKRYMNTAPLFLNLFLSGQGFPKSAMFSFDKPVETISAAVNHLAKKYLNMKFDSKMYVKPAVKYIKEVFGTVQNMGALTKSLDKKMLSDKLTDTINLDIIEPILRVNRAFKFARKVPKCDRYVMCLINKELPEDDPALPGVKKGLSKGTSLILSWFLSNETGTSFWHFYTVIIEDRNCKTFYADACNDFHIEETKTTKEYVHSEL